MDAALPVSAVGNDVPLDAGGHLAADVHCLHCGYNLRSMNIAGDCPECGEAVEGSARGDLLQFADPQWLASLNSGLKWMLTSLVATIVITVGMPVLLMAFGTAAFALYRWAGVAGLLTEVIMLVGIWKFTAPNPRWLDAEASPRSPRIARLAEAVGVLVTLVTAAISLMSLPLDIWAGQALQLLGLLIGAVVVVALLMWLIWLATRLPVRKLMRQARLVGWGFGIASALMIILGTGQLIWFQSQTSQPPASQSVPAYTVQPPTQAAQVTATTLADGTRRTTYPANDPASPNPAGVTTHDVMPNGDTRTYTVIATPGGTATTTDEYRGPSATVLTITTTDASGNVLSQNTSTTPHSVFGGPVMIAFQLSAAVVFLAYATFYVWAIILMVWFYRRLRSIRSAEPSRPDDQDGDDGDDALFAV